MGERLRALRNLSIRSKLVGIILLTTLVALVVGFVFLQRESRRSFEQDLIRSLRIIADLQSRYSAVGLAFDQRDLAELDKWAPVPLITDAYIFDTQGQLFDAFSRAGEITPPARVPTLRQHSIRDGFAHYFEPIFHEGERIGTLYLRATTEALEQRLAEHERTMAGLMVAVLALAAALAYVLQGVISRPIQALAAVARKITREGDYSLRVDKPGDDEIGQLYDGFNAMLAAIHERQDELERSNRDLDQFAYVASHDLKAPLRAISNLSTWLEEDHGAVLPAEAREQLALLRARVHRMDELIDGVLEYSRLGRGDSSVQQVDVGQLVTDVVEMIDTPEGVELDVGPMPTLTTHRLRLGQVLSNLIANAIKHHHRPERARIDVRAEPVANGYAFTVADDGPGIAPGNQQRVFRMFQTLDDASDDEGGHGTGGTGLGLALVRKLVEDEGGTISLVSELGRGSTFRFVWPSLPRAPAS